MGNILNFLTGRARISSCKALWELPGKCKDNIKLHLGGRTNRNWEIWHQCLPSPSHAAGLALLAQHFFLAVPALPADGPTLHPCHLAPSDTHQVKSRDSSLRAPRLMHSHSHSSGQLQFPAPATVIIRPCSQQRIRPFHL